MAHMGTTGPFGTRGSGNNTSGSSSPKKVLNIVKSWGGLILTFAAIFYVGKCVYTKVDVHREELGVHRQVIIDDLKKNGLPLDEGWRYINLSSGKSISIPTNGKSFVIGNVNRPVGIQYSVDSNLSKWSAVEAMSSLDGGQPRWMKTSLQYKLKGIRLSSISSSRTIVSLKSVVYK
jgi:hypothetical protein